MLVRIQPPAFLCGGRLKVGRDKLGITLRIKRRWGVIVAVLQLRISHGEGVRGHDFAGIWRQRVAATFEFDSRKVDYTGCHVGYRTVG